jgi:hypothetical protein
MAVVVLLEFPGFTTADYDAVMGSIGLDGKLPPHAQFHVSGQAEDGLRIVDVWESAEAFQAFAEERIMPNLAANNIAGQPNIQIWPVHNILR